MFLIMLIYSIWVCSVIIWFVQSYSILVRSILFGFVLINSILRYFVHLFFSTLLCPFYFLLSVLLNSITFIIFYSIVHFNYVSNYVNLLYFGLFSYHLLCHILSNVLF